MRWNEALNRIGTALKNGKDVEITYHRRYNTKIYYTDKVDGITEYQWHGVPEYDISTYRGLISNYSYIVDEITVR